VHFIYSEEVSEPRHYLLYTHNRGICARWS